MERQLLRYGGMFNFVVWEGYDASR